MANEPETIRLPKRSETPKEYQWNTALLYDDEARWEADFAEVQQELTKAADFAGRLGEGAHVVLDFFQWDEAVSRKLEKLYLYASMRHDEDKGEARYQAMDGRMESLAVAAAEATSFFAPELLSLSDAVLDAYLADPALSLYRRALEDILRERAHVLSPEVEQVLAGTHEMASAFSNVFGILTTVDMEFPVITNEDGKPEQVSAANYTNFLRCRNREVRKAAFDAMYGTYAAFGRTIATTYGASVKKDNFYARTRGFDSALAASMFGDNVDTAVYRQLVATVRKHLPAFHRYLERRKEILGLDELHMYDLYVPLFPDPEKDFSYEQAKETVLSALAPLGSDYVARLKEGLESGWVDVYPNRGKCVGAYSSGVYDSVPYILLNYQNNLDNVFTLAHEAGHSMHSLYSRMHQPYIYADYRIFVAEVASTVNENILNAALLAAAKDKDEKNYLINHYLEDFRATVIRQTMFAEFELTAHEMAAEGKGLTAEDLCQLYYQLNVDYFGPGVVVDDAIRWEWARIPHFYRTFYVYKYATGFCAASALSQALLDADAEQAAAARKRYLTFLAGGCSKDPLDLLRDAGVDMTKAEPLDAAFALFAKRTEEMV